jgi:hypothetical protein
MSFLHKQSNECSKSELDLFQVPPTQISYEAARIVDYYPISNIDNGPIEFFISGSSDEYIDLSQTYLYLETQILDNELKPITDQVVAPVNLFLHSLFSQVDVSLNETLVTASVNTYPYRCIFETLLNYGSDAKTSQLSTSLFYKDDSGKMESIIADASSKDSNSGFLKRQKIAKNSSFDMFGRLHIDMFMQDRLLINNVNVKLRLSRSKPSFCLMGEGEFKININKAILSVRKLKVNPRIMLALAAVLEKNTLIYAIKRPETKVMSITQGTRSKTLDSVSLGTLPKKIVFGFVEGSTFSGDYKKNPFNFQNFDLSKISVSIDREEAPYSPLELDFTNKLYSRAYYSLFNGLDRGGLDCGNSISHSDFSNGYAIFAFDMTPNMCNGDHFNLVKSGNLRISLIFSSETKSNINCIIYMEHENILEIIKSRQIVFDYIF